MTNRLKRLYVVSFLLVPSLLFAQEPFLNLEVHVWGEVNKPGEYKVTDGTDLLGLISKAGGPTQQSKLTKVRLTRTLDDGTFMGSELASTDPIPPGNFMIESRRDGAVRVYEIDIEEYLKQEGNTASLPILRSGDVVMIPRKSAFSWRAFSTVLRDVAIVANAYYWFRRAEK